MKAYVVMSVEYDPEENDIWGYVYQNDQLLSIHSSLDGAKNFVLSKASARWDIPEELILFKQDDGDTRIHYIFEKGNELTRNGEDLMWGVIIEREMNLNKEEAE